MRSTSASTWSVDELTYLLSYGYLDSDAVLDALAHRPLDQHVIVTGRGASDALIELADTVSIIADEKHAYRAGIKSSDEIEVIQVKALQA